MDLKFNTTVSISDNLFNSRANRFEYSCVFFISGPEIMHWISALELSAWRGKYTVPSGNLILKNFNWLKCESLFILLRMLSEIFVSEIISISACPRLICVLVKLIVSRFWISSRNDDNSFWIEAIFFSGLKSTVIFNMSDCVWVSSFVEVKRELKKIMAIEIPRLKILNLLFSKVLLKNELYKMRIPLL